MTADLSAPVSPLPIPDAELARLTTQDICICGFHIHSTTLEETKNHIAHVSKLDIDSDHLVDLLSSYHHLKSLSASPGQRQVRYGRTSPGSLTFPTSTAVSPLLLNSRTIRPSSSTTIEEPRGVTEELIVVLPQVPSSPVVSNKRGRLNPPEKQQGSDGDNNDDELRLDSRSLQRIVNIRDLVRENIMCFLKGHYFATSRMSINPVWLLRLASIDLSSEEGMILSKALHEHLEKRRFKPNV